MGGQAKAEVTRAEKQQPQQRAHDKSGNALHPVAVDHGERQRAQRSGQQTGAAFQEKLPHDALAENEFFAQRPHHAEQQHAPYVFALGQEDGGSAVVAQSERLECRRHAPAEQQHGGYGQGKFQTGVKGRAERTRPSRVVTVPPPQTDAQRYFIQQQRDAEHHGVGLRRFGQCQTGCSARGEEQGGQRCRHLHDDEKEKSHQCFHTSLSMFGGYDLITFDFNLLR